MTSVMPPRAHQPVTVVATSLACAAGVGKTALFEALQHNRSALQPYVDGPLNCWVGEVPELMRQGRLPAHLQHWDCRATRLAWLGLQADELLLAAAAARTRWGSARVGLVLGTSASTIAVSEQAYRALDEQGRFPAPLRSAQLNNMHALTAFVQEALQLGGPAITVSTACSSSAKAFAQAARWLQLGLLDAVVVGGVDALCNSILYGFRALQLVAPEACQPFAAQRCGISIGEAAGFALLQRGGEGMQLLGYGEANDAHHMSSPHPEGLGAEKALQVALQRANLPASALEHVSLHGTATPLNDQVEAALVARCYSADVHASATKGCTGHTMGAAGMLGALACELALQQALQAGSPGTAAVDPLLPARFQQQLRLQPQPRRARTAALHAFGFGGNNAVLIFGGAA